MPVTQTSLFAYEEVKQNIGATQKAVFNAIKEIQPCSNQQIAKYLGWEINRVTGRVNEMVGAGLVEAHGKAKNDFNRLVIVWKINTNN